MKFLQSTYLTNRLYAALLVCVVLFITGYFVSAVYLFAQALFAFVAMLFVVDLLLVFGRKNGLEANRIMADKFSNGDENPVIISIRSKYPYAINASVIDETPDIFQIRDMQFEVPVSPGKEKLVHYNLRPLKRGEYVFGRLNIYVSGAIGFVRKRYIFEQGKAVKVYPSYMQMRKYELMAISNRLTEAGIKKIRKIGRTMEFDQVKDYVAGDDIRTLNWKATARKGDLMVNQYQDEKSQQVYCIIEKGRVMQMPFEGLSLLDYAINTSLVISNIAQLKHDKPGLLTFSERMGSFVPAERRGMQMQKILEVLYNQKTRYLESDHEKLFVFIKRRITHRSLLLFFTNFETLSSLKRQLPFFQRLAKNHLLVVIFFENTELKALTEREVFSTEDIYVKTVAEGFAMEKKQIVKELNKNGIHAILSAPQNLSVNTINKYLELKARGQF
ncbi:MAG: DUF58 domain-containing protein [Bacteroidia bacterium]